MEEVKKCLKCEKNLPKYQYEIYNKSVACKETGLILSKPYFRNTCKSCRKGKEVIPREIRSIRRPPKEALIWKYYLKRAYGITPEDYNNILKSQNNCCKICKSNVRLHLDHCHTTGKVRGILCQGCNTGLGSFRDNIESLKLAIEYLS